MYSCEQESTMPTKDRGKKRAKDCNKCGEESNYNMNVPLNLKECLQSICDIKQVQHHQRLTSSSCSTNSSMEAPREPVPSRCNSVDSAPSSAAIDVVGDADHDDANVDEDAVSSSSEDASETSSLNQEVRRLNVLKSYLGVLDMEHGYSHSFERLTALATRIFRSPMALVTIADLDRQYCLASRGLDASLARKSPFCSHAVLSDSDLLVVTDAASDLRFASDPQVAGSPHIRFYAGAPLVCPEGYRLGTLCVMDTKPRLKDPELDEKQSLMELAAMAMETLVDLRKKRNSALTDPAQQIACTAHDLLTPLTGIALSLSLLREDEALKQKLTEQQKDMIETAANCSSVMNSICQRTMEVFRDQGRRCSHAVNASVAVAAVAAADSANNNARQPRQSIAKKTGPSIVKVTDLVKNLNMVMEPFPKQVPLIITVDPKVPPEFVSDDMKIFRSATNFLTNACAKTESGSIHLKIFCISNSEKMPELIFECEDTGPGVDVAKYAYLFKRVREETDPLRVSRSRTILEDVPAGACRAAVQNTGLGLYSVATQISSIGGKYGFRPRGHSDHKVSDREQHTGSIFWFSIPLVQPQNAVPRTVPSTNPCAISQTGNSIRGLNTQMLQEDSELEKIEDTCGRQTRMLGTKVSVRSPGAAAVYSSESKKSLPTQGVKSPTSSAQKTALSTHDAVAVYSSSSQASLSTKSLKRLTPTPELRKNHALVVEDSLVVRKSLARALSKLGFEVTQAVNGMEGLKALQTSLFDVVLCDFLMPVMDGLDCIQQYRQWEAANRPSFRQYIVGISAHASEKDVEQGLRVGMDEFRPKPVTYKELIDLKNGLRFNRVSKELDSLGQEIQSLKRRKIQPSPKSNPPDQDVRVCLVVEGSTVISRLAELATERKGWKIVSVNDSDSALRLLKMRNWDAVLLDDELSGSRFMPVFREWEKRHRVNRQKNVVFLSANFISPHDETSSSFQVPTGFDGALGKPIHLTTLQTFLNKAAEMSTCYACDIVTR